MDPKTGNLSEQEQLDKELGTTIPDEILIKAKKIAARAYHHATDGRHVAPEEWYIVWFAKVLQNWKATLSSDAFHDGTYIELTYNGNKQETYADVYKKQFNMSYSDEDF